MTPGDEIKGYDGRGGAEDWRQYTDAGLRLIRGDYLRAARPGSSLSPDLLAVCGWIDAELAHRSAWDAARAGVS